MKITDLLKKVSLVAAVSAVALPAYASGIVDGADEVAVEALKVHATAVAGPLSFQIVDHKNGNKKIMTMTNCFVEQVSVNVEGFVGKHSFLTIVGGDDLMASSNGIFKFFNLGAAMREEMTPTEAVATTVTPFLEGVADSEEHARDAAEEKALEKKALAEEQEALARQLAEEEALAKKLVEEEALALRLEEEAAAKKLESEKEVVEVLDVDDLDEQKDNSGDEL